MAAAVLDGVESWTGYRPRTCPWRPIAKPPDPFVTRVQQAWPWYEKQQLELFEPDASYRLVQGVAFYDRTLIAVESRMHAADRANAAAKAGR